MEKKNKKIFYLMLGVSIILIAGMTATFAYFSASKTTPANSITGGTNDFNLSLNVERVHFAGATAESDNLVPAYFGKNSYDQLNVRYPSDLKQANVTSMVSNKCEKDGFTGCHVYKITFSSTKTIPEANLYLNLNVTKVSAARGVSGWGYALFTETGNVTNAETTGLALLTGNGIPGSIGNGVTNLDIHNGGGLTANTPVIYYLLIYINDNDKAQDNTAQSAYDNVLGTYNGSVNLSTIGGELAAYFNTRMTPITDFEYAIGSYTYSDGDNEYTINIPDNDVLLLKYDQPYFTQVNIPSKYIIDGREYTPVIFAYSKGDTSTDTTGTFIRNRNITSVQTSADVKYAHLHNSAPTTLNYGNASYAFDGCSSLVNAPTIPSSVTDMSWTFSVCTSLVNAPAIPSSVTNMHYTFLGCKSLVNAPSIPSSVTNMDGTFAFCTSLLNAPDMSNATSVTNMKSTFYRASLINAPDLTNTALLTNMNSTFLGCNLKIAPEIPNSVTNMTSTFEDCEFLVNAPTIPSSVTGMQNTFYGCKKLEGTVRVNSDKVSFTGYTFSGTRKSITLDVPADSTTYEYFSKDSGGPNRMSYSNNYSYSTLPSNVTLITH